MVGWVAVRSGVAQMTLSSSGIAQTCGRAPLGATVRKAVVEPTLFAVGGDDPGQLEAVVVDQIAKARLRSMLVHDPQRRGNDATDSR